jgi:hypothetical protein
MMNKIKQLLSWNNYTISYFLVSILLVFSYYSVRSIMINQSPWFIVQASDLTLNVILLYGLVGLMIDKATKKMSKVKSWGIFLIAFIVLTAFFAIVGGFNVRWISD